MAIEYASMGATPATATAAYTRRQWRDLEKQLAKDLEALIHNAMTPCTRIEFVVMVVEKLINDTEKNRDIPASVLCNYDLGLAASFVDQIKKFLKEGQTAEEISSNMAYHCGQIRSIRTTNMSNAHLSSYNSFVVGVLHYAADSVLFGGSDPKLVWNPWSAGFTETRAAFFARSAIQDNRVAYETLCWQFSLANSLVEKQDAAATSKLLAFIETHK